MADSLIDRLKRRLIGKPPPVIVPAAVEVPSEPDRVTLTLRADLQQAFAAEYPVAQAATDRVLAALPGLDLSPLARRSPSLEGYDWRSYLQCSVCRIVRFQRALARHVPAGGRVLDYGSYFGNFGLASRAMGFAVEAIDSYRLYGAALDPFVALQREAGIVVHDFETDAGLLGAGAFDAVMCAGVLEHIPHSPRTLLESIVALLRPGGVLVLDTPNLAYLYKRLALLEGRTIFAPVSDQYYTELPFEGHHREYTVGEVEWMLTAAGMELQGSETFNYSLFEHRELVGADAVNYREMERDPSLREVILAVATRRRD